ncbi:hypothetical protein EJB05_37856, partial [Eragrostis curvula]
MSRTAPKRAPAKQQHGGRRGRGSGDDQLSSLPDGLLHAVLSFHKSRQVVQTSVLSKRWRHLWRSMPCLDIDQSEFPGRTTAPGTDHDFENFADNLLLFHDAPLLHRFRLSSRCAAGGPASRNHNRDADRWIRGGIKNCPSMLEIDLGDYCIGVPLPDLGTCSHLLKRLHLSGMSLNDGFAQLLHFGCPVLEDLEIKHCFCLFRGITSHTLKTLTICGCLTCPGDDCLIIAAPALVSLHLDVDVFNYKAGVSVNEAANLVNAFICSDDNKGLCKLLDGLTSVESLELSETMVPMDGGSENFPTFSNLRSLTLDHCDMTNNFQILRHFLQNASNLEKLTLQYCKLPEGSKKRKGKDKPKWASSRRQDLTFQCPNLKLTEIKYSKGDDKRLFELLFGIWSNLRRATLILTKD